MKFDDWEPAYEAIRQDFGYDREADRRGRDVLAGSVDSFDLSRLQPMDGATVTVVGAGPELADALEEMPPSEYVVAASSAVQRVRDAGIEVDLMVTDLDKIPETARTLTHEGVPVAVHGHGDNIPVLETHVPTFETGNVLPTTQVESNPPVYNFGGFTDGDRAAFIADEFGAETLRFVGWDLSDRRVCSEKRRKLHWAARLLRWLEIRRDARYTLLDGLRDELRLTWLE